MKKLIAYILWLIMGLLVAVPFLSAIISQHNQLQMLKQILEAPQASAQTIPVMGAGQHAAHDYSFGPVTLATGVSLAHVLFDPEGNNKKGSPGRLQANETMTVVLELSRNGGMTYEPAGGGNFNSLNQPRDFDVTLADPTNPARVLSGRVTIIGNWKGSASVELE